MQYQLEAIATCAAVFVYVILRRRRLSIADVPGPENPSWIFGTSPEGQPHSPSLPVDRRLNGLKDTSGISWSKKSGEWRRGSSRSSGTSFAGRVLLGYASLAIEPATVSCVPGIFTDTIGSCIQEDRLWIGDPKAINHILQKSGYLYAKPSDLRERSALMSDRGILWAKSELPPSLSPPSPLLAL